MKINACSTSVSEVSSHSYTATPVLHELNIYSIFFLNIDLSLESTQILTQRNVIVLFDNRGYHEPRRNTSRDCSPWLWMYQRWWLFGVQSETWEIFPSVNFPPYLKCIGYIVFFCIHTTVFKLHNRNHKNKLEVTSWSLFVMTTGSGLQPCSEVVWVVRPVEDHVWIECLVCCDLSVSESTFCNQKYNLGSSKYSGLYSSLNRDVWACLSFKWPNGLVSL